MAHPDTSAARGNRSFSPVLAGGRTADNAASLDRAAARVLLDGVERGEVLVVGCGLLHEIDGAPAGLTFHVVDIDERAVAAVLAKNDPRISGGTVVMPEAPIDLGRKFVAIYAKEVVMADFEEADDGDVFKKVRTDLDAKGVAMSDPDLRRVIVDLMEKAIAEIKAG